MIGSLQGPLHGAATKTVIETLDEIGSPDHAEEWVEEQIENDEAKQQFRTAEALRDAVGDARPTHVHS